MNMVTLEGWNPIKKVKKAVKKTTSAVKAPISATKNIVSASASFVKNPSINNLVKVGATAIQAPLDIASSATKLADNIKNIPVVGGIVMSVPVVNTAVNVLAESKVVTDYANKLNANLTQAKKAGTVAKNAVLNTGINIKQALVDNTKSIKDLSDNIDKIVEQGGDVALEYAETIQEELLKARADLMGIASYGIKLYEQGIIR